MHLQHSWRHISRQTDDSIHFKRLSVTRCTAPSCTKFHANTSRGSVFPCYRTSSATVTSKETTEKANDSSDRTRPPHDRAKQRANHPADLWQCFASMPMGVVGVHHYRMQAQAPPSCGEVLSLVREPHNHFDSNAIAVLDAEDAMLGYLPKEWACHLSPLIDGGKLAITGVAAHEPTKHSVPIEVFCFAPCGAEAQETARHLTSQGLSLEILQPPLSPPALQAPPALPSSAHSSGAAAHTPLPPPPAANSPPGAGSGPAVNPSISPPLSAHTSAVDHPGTPTHDPAPPSQPAPKRRRGRPRKNPAQVQAEPGQGSNATTTATTTAAPSQARGDASAPAAPNSPPEGSSAKKRGRRRTKHPPSPEETGSNTGSGDTGSACPAVGASAVAQSAASPAPCNPADPSLTGGEAELLPQSLPAPLQPPAQHQGLGHQPPTVQQTGQTLTYASFSKWGPARIQDVAAPEPWCHVRVPPEMRFGVELETVIRQRMKLHVRRKPMFNSSQPGLQSQQSLQFKLSCMGAAHWSVKSDASIRPQESIKQPSGPRTAVTVPTDPTNPTPWVGAELVSPILSGHTGIAHIYRMAATLKPLPMEVNTSTGLHVHVSCLPGSSLPHLARLAHLWLALEPALDMLTPHHRRKDNCPYAQSILPPPTPFQPSPASLPEPAAGRDRGRTPRDAVNRGRLIRPGLQGVLETLSALAGPPRPTSSSGSLVHNPHRSHPVSVHPAAAPLISSTIGYQISVDVQRFAFSLNPKGRYYKINFCSLFKHGTVEFRHPPADTRPDVITGFVLLYLKMVQFSLQGDVRQLAARALAGAMKICEEALQKCEGALALAHAALIEAAEKLEGGPKAAVMSAAQAWQAQLEEVRSEGERFAGMVASGGAAFELWVVANACAASSSGGRPLVRGRKGSREVAAISPWFPGVCSVVAAVGDAPASLQGVLPSDDCAAVFEPLQAAAAAAADFEAATEQTSLHTCILEQLEGSVEGELLSQGGHSLSPAQRLQLAPLLYWLQAVCVPEEGGLVRWFVAQAARFDEEGNEREAKGDASGA